MISGLASRCTRDYYYRQELYESCPWWRSDVLGLAFYISDVLA